MGVARSLLKEMISRFRPPQSPQSGNRPSFMSWIPFRDCYGSKMTITLCLEPPIIRKRRSKLNSSCTLAKLHQKPPETWVTVLPITLTRIQNAPRTRLHESLSCHMGALSYPVACGRPPVVCKNRISSREWTTEDRLHFQASLQLGANVARFWLPDTETAPAQLPGRD